MPAAALLLTGCDTAQDGPSATCARLSAAPVQAPAAGAGSGSGTTTTPAVASGARLPSTGGVPLLAVAGLLLLGTAAATRRCRV